MPFIPWPGPKTVPFPDERAEKMQKYTDHLFDGLGKSRHSRAGGSPEIGRLSKRLDSRFHGKDGKGPFQTFYEIIIFGLKRKKVFFPVEDQTGDRQGMRAVRAALAGPGSTDRGSSLGQNKQGKVPKLVDSSRCLG